MGFHSDGTGTLICPKTLEASAKVAEISATTLTFTTCAGLRRRRSLPGTCGNDAETAKEEDPLIGQSAHKTSHFEKAVPVLKPTVLQCWAHMMDTKFVVENGLVGQLLKKNRLSFIAFSPLNQGVLTGKYYGKDAPRFEVGDHRRNSRKFSNDSLRSIDIKLDALKSRFGDVVHASSVALRFILNYPNVASVIQVSETGRKWSRIWLCRTQLSGDDMEFIPDLFQTASGHSTGRSLKPVGTGAVLDSGSTFAASVALAFWPVCR